MLMMNAVRHTFNDRSRLKTARLGMLKSADKKDEAEMLIKSQKYC